MLGLATKKARTLQCGPLSLMKYQTAISLERTAARTFTAGAFSVVLLATARAFAFLAAARTFTVLAAARAFALFRLTFFVAATGTFTAAAFALALVSATGAFTARTFATADHVTDAEF